MTGNTTTTPAADIVAGNTRRRRTREDVEKARAERDQQQLENQRRVASEAVIRFKDTPEFKEAAAKAGESMAVAKLASIMGMSIGDFLKAHPHTSGDTGKPSLDRAQFMVEIDPEFYIAPAMRRKFTHYDKLAKAGQQVHALFTGPTGCGKTEMALQAAAVAGRPVFVADAANKREPRDWFGRRGARSGSTTWESTAFIDAVEAGGFIILIEEMNRAPANVLNGIFGLLDRRKGAFIEEAGRKVTVGDNTIWLATLNEGAEYSGTYATDAAIRSRFSRRIEVDWIPKDEEMKVLMKRVSGLKEEDAERLAEVAATVRKKSNAAFSAGSKITRGISTRQLIDAAHDLMALGVEGLRDCIISHYSDDGADTERKEVMAIFQGKWPSLK